MYEALTLNTSSANDLRDAPQSSRVPQSEANVLTEPYKYYSPHPDAQEVSAGQHALALEFFKLSPWPSEDELSPNAALPPAGCPLVGILRKALFMVAT